MAFHASLGSLDLRIPMCELADMLSNKSYTKKRNLSTRTITVDKDDKKSYVCRHYRVSKVIFVTIPRYGAVLKLHSSVSIPKHFEALTSFKDGLHGQCSLLLDII